MNLLTNSSVPQFRFDSALYQVSLRAGIMILNPCCFVVKCTRKKHPRTNKQTNQTNKQNDAKTLDTLYCIIRLLQSDCTYGVQELLANTV